MKLVLKFGQPPCTVGSQNVKNHPSMGFSALYA